MRDNILIVLAVLILATMWFQISTQNTKYRYDVITGSNMLTILVDKKQGIPGEIVYAETKLLYLDAGKK